MGIVFRSYQEDGYGSDEPADLRKELEKSWAAGREVSGHLEHYRQVREPELQREIERLRVELQEEAVGAVAWMEEIARLRKENEELKSPKRHPGLDLAGMEEDLEWLKPDDFRVLQDWTRDMIAHVRRQSTEIARLREAFKEFDTWVSGFEKPRTGMGAGLFHEMWPNMTPSAWKRMRRILDRCKR